MEVLGVVHNDFHPYNLYIRTLSEDETYRVKNYSYELKEGSYGVIIFDFDRAYAETFGDNSLLEKYDNVPFCYTQLQCNEFGKGRDLLKLIAWLYHMELKDQAISLLNLTLVDGQNNPYYKDALERLDKTINTNCKTTGDNKYYNMLTDDNGHVKYRCLVRKEYKRYDIILSDFVENAHPLTNKMNLLTNIQYNNTRDHLQEKLESFDSNYIDAMDIDSGDDEFKEKVKDCVGLC